MIDPADGFKKLAAAFEQLGVEYFVGGSIASCYYSIPRGTQDIDIIAAVRPEHIDGIERLLGSDFYADSEMMRQSIRRGKSFNLIHLATSYKFDIFPLRSDEFHQLQFSRRQHADLSAAGLPGAKSNVASAEDILLEKLAWYRAGGGTSERQWNDILSILAVQKGKLDDAYLNRWSAFLQVDDLLALARSEAP